MVAFQGHPHVNKVNDVHLSKHLFHPYDGGGDFILSSNSERNALKNKYKEWLSAHPEGL